MFSNSALSLESKKRSGREPPDLVVAKTLTTMPEKQRGKVCISDGPRLSSRVRAHEENSFKRDNKSYPKRALK